MTKEQIKEILNRVLIWPPQSQEGAARLLRDMEEADASPYRYTDEQLEQVDRRRVVFLTGKDRCATDEEMTTLWKWLHFGTNAVYEGSQSPTRAARYRHRFFPAQCLAATRARACGL